MAYGKIKADAIIRDNSGTDEEITMATIVGLDTNKAPKASPTFTGTPAAPTASTGTDSTQIATTAFVKAQSYATLASPTLTGTPAAPTASAGTNTTQIATTAYVQAEGFTKAATANEWTAGQRGEVTNIDSSSGVLAIDFDASNNFLCITTENITDINYTNLDQDMVGQTGSIFFQFGGSHTVGGWDTETRWIGGTGGTSEAPTFTATSGQCDRVDYIIVGDRDTPSQRSHVRVQMVASLNYAD